VLEVKNLQFWGQGLDQTSSEKHQDVEHVSVSSFGAVHSRKTNGDADLTDIYPMRRKARIEEMTFQNNREWNPSWTFHPSEAEDCRCQPT
jgi:hypothetical protein